MIATRVPSPGARLRHLRREAARRGMLVRTARTQPSLHRYILVDRDAHMIKISRNLEFPYSFSLEEAEAYLERRF